MAKDLPDFASMGTTFLSFRIGTVAEAQVYDKPGVQQIALEPLVIHIKRQRGAGVGDAPRHIHYHGFFQPVQRTNLVTKSPC